MIRIYTLPPIFIEKDPTKNIFIKCSQHETIWLALTKSYQISCRAKLLTSQNLHLSQNSLFIMNEWVQMNTNYKGLIKKTSMTWTILVLESELPQFSLQNVWFIGFIYASLKILVGEYDIVLYMWWERKAQLTLG